MSTNLRRIVASVAAWVVGTAAAVGVGLLALSVVGGQPAEQTPQALTPESVAEQASATTPADTPAPTAAAEDRGNAGRETERAEPGSSSSSDREEGDEKLLTSPGGTAIATCSSQGAYLVSWSPAQGYRVDEVQRGPDSTAKVEFQSSTRKILLTVRCVGGTPQAEVLQETR